MTRAGLGLAAAGLLLAALAGGVGLALERTRFGSNDEASVARIEAELRGRFDRATATLGAIASRVAGSSDAIQNAPRDATAMRRLFEAL